MAIELCSAETIPRISFSHVFCSSMPLNTSIDFEFDIPINNIDQERYYSSADELFSNGKILPLQIRKEIFPPPKQPQKPQPQSGNATGKNTKVGIKEANDENQSCKSFWQFKRSSSLNFVSGYKRKLFPSTLLSRSSSTGSAPIPKVKPGQNYEKEKPYTFLKSSTNNQKPPLKRGFSFGYHGNGVTINPVLNVPLVDVFCFSSVFLTGKDKKK